MYYFKQSINNINLFIKMIKKKTTKLTCKHFYDEYKKNLLRCCR